jgi:hypothetical protein
MNYPNSLIAGFPEDSILLVVWLLCFILSMFLAFSGKGKGEGENLLLIGCVCGLLGQIGRLILPDFPLWLIHEQGLSPDKAGAIRFLVDVINIASPVYLISAIFVYPGPQRLSDENAKEERYR